tara:strand:- start:8874 stop:9944 length:1071 start_codon:yes stop_codon:yes gene_type:complete
MPKWPTDLKRQPTMWQALARPGERGKKRKLRVYDLFCGIGGFSSGAAQAGHHVVLAADMDPRMVAMHRQNHPFTRHEVASLPDDEDLLQLPGHDAWKTMDWHLHGSPPCTMLSAAKWDKTNQQVNEALSMIRWYLQLAITQRPTSWSFEQVAVRDVLSACEDFKIQHPLKFDYTVVSCNEYGIPQLRKRVIGGTPWLVQKMRKMAGTTPETHSHVSHWTPVPKGYTHIQYPKWYRRSKGQTERKKLDADTLLIRPVDSPGYSITCTHCNFWTDAKGEIRKSVTPREGARLQTFNDNTLLPKNNLLAQRMVGNAVPPALATALLKDYTIPPTTTTFASDSSHAVHRPSSPSLSWEWE